MTEAVGNVTFAHRYRSWLDTQTPTTMVVLAIGWAALMGLLAQVRIPLPFTPVPFTMQVFGVLLGGVLLGSRYGTLAQIAYVGLGIVGLPWFQSYNGGWAYVLGPTGGYLLAYPIAALVAGALVEKAPMRRSVRTTLAMAGGMFVIYGLGMTWLAWALDVDLARAFALGVAPFVVLDAMKALAAAGLARAFVLPR